MEHLMGQTAITYPQCTLSDLTGEQIKLVLEDVCDNLFHPDPYLRQGGDMVRVGGLTFSCNPTAKMGSRISEMRLGGKPLGADKKYRVTGWASVQENVQGEPIWEVVATYLRSKKVIGPRRVNLPKLEGVSGNPGVA
jgi:sulfur-oxidizing protein SoxB